MTYIIICACFGFSTTNAQTTGYQYSVTAFGIGFANTTLYESIHNDTVTLNIAVRSKTLARLVYNVDNTYTTIIDRHTGIPRAQKKMINGILYSNIFSLDPIGFYDEFGFFYPTQKPSHTLFSLFRILCINQPNSIEIISAISCNTRWEVTITPDTYETFSFGGEKIAVRYYLLTFKSLESHKIIKNRYEDILEKELFWNSGILRCAVGTTTHLMYEARLISASPEVAIHLTGTFIRKD